MVALGHLLVTVPLAKPWIQAKRALHFRRHLNSALSQRQVVATAIEPAIPAAKQGLILVPVERDQPPAEAFVC